MLVVFVPEKHPMFFEEKLDALVSAGTDGAGCQALAEGPPQRGAKRGFTHGAVLAVRRQLGFCCGNVGAVLLDGFQAQRHFHSRGVAGWNPA